MYHKVDLVPPRAGYLGNYVLPEQLDNQLTALSRWGYTPITLEDWLDFRVGLRKPPRRPIALTFDDGYRSTYDIAWPILRRQDATATVFLVTDFIGKTNLWDARELLEPLLSATEIAAMHARRIHFGSHTCTHRSLTGMSAAEALVELTRSRAALRTLLGRPIFTLAYPYNNNNYKVRRLARQAAYKSAVLGRARLNARSTSPWPLPRTQIDTP